MFLFVLVDLVGSVFPRARVLVDWTLLGFFPPVRMASLRVGIQRTHALPRTGATPCLKRPSVCRVPARRADLISTGSNRNTLFGLVGLPDIPDRSPVAVKSTSGTPATTDGSEDRDQGIQWGADLKKLAICVGVGTLIWFAPVPEGISQQAWHLLSIFLGTIVGIITTPLPLGAVAMLGLGVAMVTKTLTFAAAFSAFASEIP